MKPRASAQAAVLFSGGMDSAVLVAHLLAGGHRVWPILVDCRWRWQVDERRAARQFLDRLRGRQGMLGPGRLEDLVELEMPLADLYESHWSMSGLGVPGATRPDEEVYLPGHNPLLLIKAQLWCHAHGVDQLAMATLAGNPFADATEEFVRQFEGAMNLAVGGAVRLVRPFAELDKPQVMELGRGLPLELTFSCLAPRGGLHCGACNKCAERQRAFAAAGWPDATRYAAASKALP